MAFMLVPGTTYRLTVSLKIGRCVFRSGEVVMFSSGGYSPYDDCYVYHFVDSAGEKRICASQAELTEAEQANFDSAQ